MAFINKVGFLVLFLFLVLHESLGQVIDLDDSFTDKKGDRAFLVKFYAPWCGHCRKLEPTYHQVYLELKSSKITVAKVDATRFTRLASEYEVHGYPTIKFIQGNRIYTHNGERSKEGIMEFAKRAFGPQVRMLASLGRLSEAKVEHMTTAFFLYIGPIADNELYKVYKSLAEKYAVLSYFYAGDRNVLPPEIMLSNYPTVAVFKDGIFSEFTAVPEPDNLQAVLDSWVNKERFVAFPKISGVGLNEMSSIGKMLAIFVIDDNKDDKTSDKQTSAERYRDIGQRLATDSLYAAYRSQYQLVWMTDVEVASNIIMTSIESPFVFVLNPQTHQYYIPHWTSIDEVIVDVVTLFLDSVHNGSQQVYGGSGIGQRFKRLFYDIWTTVYGIYRESVWLALMVFGIPTLVIGIICYTLCCLEPADEDELNTGSDEDGEGSEQLEDEPVSDLSDRPRNELTSDHAKTE